MSIVYDAGVLVAAERNDRNAWADHRTRLELGLVPTTTAPVVAQVSRSDRQVQLRRFLRGCQTAAFENGQAHEVGELLGRAGTSDVVDAHIVLTAAETASAVLSGDVADLSLLSGHLQHPIEIRAM
ncbi:MAG: twitching motility protein PilT [Acidimicrobiales bacterium]